MILLFGSPRSGTTWLGKIFDSHPDTLYRHEPDSCLRAEEIPLYPPASRFEELADGARDYVRRVVDVRTTKVSGKLPLFPKSYYSPLRRRAREKLVLAAKLASRYLGELEVPDLFDRAEFPQVRLVWKSIESAGRLGLFVRALPASRAVLIVRHPCGYIGSILRGERSGGFTAAEPASEDYGILGMLLETDPARRRGLTLAAMRELRPEERLAWRWVLLNEKAMEDVEGLDRCTVVPYEDLCAEPERVARRLFDFTGLSWSSQTEGFLRASTDHEEGAYHSVFKNPARSAAKWREELQPDVIRRILDVARDSRPGRLFR